MLTKVLVANRGEIARRVQRTCAKLGIATVAVYSDADRDAPHVREADEAVRLGPPPATESYLDVARVVAAALDTGCDAVHPGYGFLAEHAGFARAVREAGLRYVGPSPEVVELMGDKSAARRRLAAIGVPVVPGLDVDDGDDAFVAAAAELGAPLLVKAVAGGGGKGMREVEDLAELADALAAARREARAAFGDDRLLLERLVARPRHVEVQVIADQHGHVLHLGERECSVQRRHQKIVEEAPSPAVDEALRTRLTDDAVRIARDVGYEGAGTIEFLVDGATLDQDEPAYHFLEMNTRLQVEHPVTEAITGLDLVELQLRVAAGEPLGIDQDEVVTTGHAIEVRVCAEDPVTHLPQTGPVAAVEVPDAPDVRWDGGVTPGDHVGAHYDPLLAKLIVHADDRATAIARLGDVLADTSVRGVVTNLSLLRAVITHPAFGAGQLTTAFLPEHLGDWRPEPADPAAVCSAVAALHAEVDAEVAGGDTAGRSPGPWTRLGPGRPTGAGGWPLRLEDPTDGRIHHLEVRRRRHTTTVRWRDEVPDAREAPAAREARAAREAPATREVRAAREAPAAREVRAAREAPAAREVRDGPQGTVGADAASTDPTGRDAPDDADAEVAGTAVVLPAPGRSDVVEVEGGREVWVHDGGRTHRLRVLPVTRAADAAAAGGATDLTAPMPGSVLTVAVEPGQTVDAGATLVVVEAMKMEHAVTAPAAGTVVEVHVAAGDTVAAGAPLVVLDPGEPAGPDPSSSVGAPSAAGGR